ncbi:MAD2L1-binding protein isoform X2 [Periophthalmus magnuspinnatus]|uniref:MAD2L1-binding protein isoform X2 n=1 Tax=Periophthalmus magnuspinnatus TaxID=409849 RepID=UPI00243729FA|nr:MAD2L1-binding protein isoform X2 [Periophthalmus magnuspinnatus]
MEGNSSILKLQMKHGNIEISPADDNEGKETQKQQSFISENDTNKSPSSSPKVTALQSVSDEETGSDKLSAEINGNVSEKSSKYCVKSKNDNEFDEDLSETRPNPPANATEVDVSCVENKENDSQPQESISMGNNKDKRNKLDQKSEDSNLGTTGQESSAQDSDAKILKRAQEEGCVNVVFPGTVTQDGCCRFVSDILKCVLFQRQQLPMTYDQLVYSQKKQQASMQGKDTVWRRPMLRADMDWRKCQQTLQELEEVLHQLEVLFSLSRVPRVLLLMGGTLFLPKEMYEINMEALVLASGDKSLRVSSCLRQLFRTLFVADLLSDTKPVRLMPTTVLVLAHRDCGVGWFRPKLQFKVPTRVKSKIMSLSTDLCSCEDLKRDELDWDDYIWFQAPMTIKGFSNSKA